MNGKCQYSSTLLTLEKLLIYSVHRNTLWKIMGSYGIPNKIINLVKCFYNNFECSVILGNTTSENFSIKSGVRQGCILSPILFLMTIDWIQRKTTREHRGIQWTLFGQIEDLDFADDIAEISSNRQHLQEKTTILNRYAEETGLKINITKTKVMTVNTTLSQPITINHNPVETVDDFTYLGSVISADNGTKKDINTRLSKARSAFARLKSIWKSKVYNKKTKIHIYNSNVKSVLLYGSECWRLI